MSKSDRTGPFTGPNQFLALGITFSLGFWFAETFVHSAIFREGTLYREMWPLDPNELWMRSFTCLLFLGFGIIARYQATATATQEAIAHQLFKVLGDYVPVCSWCRRVKAGEEEWQPIESYVTEHSGTKFSHWICPNCKAEHFSDYE